MLESEILAAINANLPSIVGETLRKRLEEARHSEQALANYKDMYAKECRAREVLESALHDMKTLDVREAEINKKLAELRGKEINQALIELRERHAIERVAELKEITLAVFANAKYKYVESVDKTVVIPGTSNTCGYTSRATDTKTITEENK